MRYSEGINEKAGDIGRFMDSDLKQEQSGGTPPAVETLIVTRVRDLVGGFKVRRALPSSRRRMVGPFIFLDQMGPEVLRSGGGLDVAPHPHIGLATVTYLFEGELLHRDHAQPLAGVYRR